MGSIDGLKEQVEELKQRLNDPGKQAGAEAGELKTRLASIKASLEGKQQEITRLTAEKERLTADVQRASSENDQLRKMLGEVLAVIGGQSSDNSANILREFLAETDPLIKPVTNGAKDAQSSGRPADQAMSGPARTDSVQAGAGEPGSGPSGGAPGTADPQVAIQLGSDVPGEGAEEEESPALRRIMRRGRRAV